MQSSTELLYTKSHCKTHHPLQIIKKYNFFTLESYSKTPGLNFHTLSIYLIDLTEAHLEAPKPGTLF